MPLHIVVLNTVLAMDAMTNHEFDLTNLFTEVVEKQKTASVGWHVTVCCETGWCTLLRSSGALPAEQKKRKTELLGDAQVATLEFPFDDDSLSKNPN